MVRIVFVPIYYRVNQPYYLPGIANICESLKLFALSMLLLDHVRLLELICVLLSFTITKLSSRYG